MSQYNKGFQQEIVVRSAVSFSGIMSLCSEQAAKEAAAAVASEACAANIKGTPEELQAAQELSAATVGSLAKAKKNEAPGGGVSQQGKKRKLQSRLSDESRILLVGLADKRVLVVVIDVKDRVRR
ncbi:hypothetical protein CDL15_Pgr022804 [Punica granatum]|uniref:Uncharacterized protein n=1 Tax=Punica granatum TaxID=22663 RepID=A0A218X4U8_PUNGR|nr:hypothetical protein CDL15_Pgr022804 [Punica granatum]